MAKSRSVLCRFSAPPARARSVEGRRSRGRLGRQRLAGTAPPDAGTPARDPSGGPMEDGRWATFRAVNDVRGCCWVVSVSKLGVAEHGRLRNSPVVPRRAGAGHWRRIAEDPSRPDNAGRPGRSATPRGRRAAGHEIEGETFNEHPARTPLVPERGGDRRGGVARRLLGRRSGGDPGAGPAAGHRRDVPPRGARPLDQQRRGHLAGPAVQRLRDPREDRFVRRHRAAARHGVERVRGRAHLHVHAAAEGDLRQRRPAERRGRQDIARAHRERRLGRSSARWSRSPRRTTRPSS